MTKEQAHAAVSRAVLYQQPRNAPMREQRAWLAGARAALDALTNAGAFEPRDLPTRQELIDEADQPRTHDDDLAYVERAIDALIAAGHLKVRT